MRAVLFDFDGTLADSFAGITASTNHVRRLYGLPDLPEAVVRESVGYGLADLMTKLVPGADPAEAVSLYRGHHPSVMIGGTRLMPGVAQTLPALHRRGLTMAVCSNKNVGFTEKLTAALGIGQYFTAVLGPESVGGRAKPDPAMLIEGLNRLSVSPREAVYVGDMAIDVHTARAAGVPVWLVPGGAAGQESATAAGPDRVLGGFGELLTLLPG
ncbi:MAG: HAD-IA family hydrolase [Gemmataceae bacterium]|nr:HAD-IA family hydrolase [Gemmataceae bacterium]